MVDFKRWAERAVDFTKRLRSLPGEIKVSAELAPPMSPPDAQALSGQLRLPLPAPLLAFLTTASCKCFCEYWWEPPAEFTGRLQDLFPVKTFIFGGASLCDSTEFATNERGCWDTADALAGDYPEDARLWSESVPFYECGNGDYVALYLGRGRKEDDCPVVYLCHDGYGASRVLAPSFEEFLIQWEQLCYIHPSFLVQFFLDPVRQCINAKSPKKEGLHELLRG